MPTRALRAGLAPLGPYLVPAEIPGATFPFFPPEGSTGGRSMLTALPRTRPVT